MEFGFLDVLLIAGLAVMVAAFGLRARFNAERRAWGDWKDSLTTDCPGCMRKIVGHGTNHCPESRWDCPVNVTTLRLRAEEAERRQASGFRSLSSKG